MALVKLASDRFDMVTPDLKYSVQLIWSKIKPSLGVYGDRLFELFFLRPDLEAYYTARSFSFVKENMHNHCVLFMRYMDRIVVSLDDKEEFMMLLKGLGDFHWHMHITLEQLLHSKDCMMQCVDMVIDNYPPEWLQAWDTFGTILAHSIFDYCKLLQEENAAKKKHPRVFKVPSSVRPTKKTPKKVSIDCMKRTNSADSASSSSIQEAIVIYE